MRPLDRVLFALVAVAALTSSVLLFEHRREIAETAHYGMSHVPDTLIASKLREDAETVLGSSWATDANSIRPVTPVPAYSLSDTVPVPDMDERAISVQSWVESERSAHLSNQRADRSLLALPRKSSSYSESAKATTYRDASSAPEIAIGPELNSTTSAARPSFPIKPTFASARRPVRSTGGGTDPSEPYLPADTDTASADGEIIERTPHIDCESPEPVEPGTKISVSVYVDTNSRHQNETSSGPLIIPFPPTLNEVPVVVYLLLSHQFRFAENTDSKILRIERTPLTPDKIRFKLRVERGAEGTGYVTALFFYRGYPCGRVKRTIRIGVDEPEGTQKNPTGDAALPLSEMGESSSIALQPDGPDMTIVVIKTDSSPPRYQYFVLAPNSKEPRGQVLKWDHYFDPTPQRLLEAYYDRFGTDFTKKQTRASLIDAGKELFGKAPADVGDKLRELIDKNQPPKSVLIFSDEPYFAWELMIPHWADKDMLTTMPLGATSAVGRWSARSTEKFRSPARHITLGTTLFWAPDYDNDKLTNSASEQDFLIKMMRGKAITPATYTGLCTELAISNANVLHLICHGSADAQQSDLPTILAKPEEIKSENDTEAGDGIKKYYHASITPGELDDCMKPFCKRRPLIFLNACQVARTMQTWSGAGGFGPRFIELNAGGVVAPLWSVFDVTAETIARKFYTAVNEHPEVPFAETLRLIRQEAYTSEDPPDGVSTYAAYCFYGDPLAVPSVVNSPP
jgi:hypothetical protein